jgi:hypothetical protein
LTNIKLILKKTLKNNIGISFNNPIIIPFLIIVDIFDAIIRFFNKTLYLPKYSIRVRSVGLTNHFGGKGFIKNGEKILSMLNSNSNLNPNSNIIEIGCGCGRTAFQLRDYLTQGKYIGLDIDKKSIDACISNSYFYNFNFTFTHINFLNDVYNPKGSIIDDNFSY